MSEGHAVISSEVLASYAADAAREVRGVHGLVGRHEGVRVVREENRLAVELQLSLDLGANAPAVAAQVQARVADCLARMAAARPDSVDVTVAEWHSESQG